MADQAIVVDGSDLAFGSAERVNPNMQASFVEGIQRRYFFRGGEDKPQLFEVIVPAGKILEPHAHTADEIIMVTEGELLLADGTCRAGSAIYVPANTLYGFTAGPEGCRFLNFRTHTAGTFSKSDAKT